MILNQVQKLEVNIFDFDKLIIGQDIIDGNWNKDDQVDMLMINEKELYEKLKNMLKVKI